MGISLFSKSIKSNKTTFWVAGLLGTFWHIEQRLLLYAYRGSKFTCFREPPFVLGERKRESMISDYLLQRRMLQSTASEVFNRNSTSLRIFDRKLSYDLLNIQEWIQGKNKQLTCVFCNKLSQHVKCVVRVIKLSSGSSIMKQHYRWNTYNPILSVKTGKEKKSQLSFKYSSLIPYVFPWHVILC